VRLGHLEVGFDLADGLDGDQLRERLATLAGVTRVEAGEHAADPWTVTVAEDLDPAGVRDAILALVAAERLPLTSIREVVPSLEDIYRRAVARPARPRPEAAA
jgi:hypothetical protein